MVEHLLCRAKGVVVRCVVGRPGDVDEDGGEGGRDGPEFGLHTRALVEVQSAEQGGLHTEKGLFDERLILGLSKV